MSARKRVLELVRDGTWRRDRHLLLLGFDFSLRDFLDLSVDRGLVELSRAERLRLEWCWYWQAAYGDGSTHPEIALERFVASMRGEHPPGLPPGMTEDEW